MNLLRSRSQALGRPETMDVDANGMDDWHPQLPRPHTQPPHTPIGIL